MPSAEVSLRMNKGADLDQEANRPRRTSPSDATNPMFFAIAFFFKSFKTKNGLPIIIITLKSCGPFEQLRFFSCKAVVRSRHINIMTEKD